MFNYLIEKEQIPYFEHNKNLEKGLAMYIVFYFVFLRLLIDYINTQRLSTAEHMYIYKYIQSCILVSAIY